MPLTALTSPAINSSPSFPSRLLSPDAFEAGVDQYMVDMVTQNGEINSFVTEVNNLVTEINALSIPTFQVLSLTSTQASTSVTLADVTQLVAPVVANATYRVTAHVTFQSAATTTGLALGFTAPASSNPMVSIEVPIVSGAAASALKVNFPAAAATTSGSVTGTGVTAINSNHTATINGVLKTGGTAGNFAVQFATEVASSAITLQIGSTLVLERIA